MKFLLAFLLTILCIATHSQLVTQQQLKELRTKSWYKACYQVPADSAYTWTLKDNINFNYLDATTPLLVVNRNADEDSVNLLPGHYIWIYSSQAEVTGELIQVSNQYFNVLNMGRQYSLIVMDKNGTPVTNATLKLGKKTIRYNEKSAAYLVPKGKYEETPFLVMTPGDTLIGSLDKKGYGYYHGRKNWRSYPVIKQVLLVKQKIRRLVNGNYRANYNKNNYRGFVAFNKPIYRPMDTVRMKAWITNKHNKPIKKDQELWLNYRLNGKTVYQKRATLQPVSKGSFVYDMVLNDSFSSNTNYGVEFHRKKARRSLYGSFKVEEYVAPDISEFSFKSDQRKYYAGDSIRLEANAKDAMGLPVLDGRLRILASTKSIRQFYADTIFIADTIYFHETTLSTTGSTNINISTEGFPNADFQLEISAALINSSNEIKEQQVTVDYFVEKSGINISIQADSILFNYANPKQKGYRCEVIAYNDEDDYLMDTTVVLPYAIKIHPSICSVDAELFDLQGKTLAYEEKEINANELKVNLYPYMTMDSIGFAIDNPHKHLLYITLSKGGKTVWEKQVSDSMYQWKDKGDINVMYNVSCRYIVANKEEATFTRLGVLNKQLHIAVNQMPVLRPGAKDVINVTVTDYKNRPVKFANLTSFAQNDQLKSKFNFVTFPQTGKYKYKNKRTWSPIETSHIDLSDEAIAFPFKNIRKALELDSMLHYSWLFSDKALTISKSSISSTLPELAVHCIKNGKPEPIYIVDINHSSVWFYGVNADQVYSTALYPGYSKIGIRLRDQYITLDSIYLQPYYKHDVFINADSVGHYKNSTIKPLKDTINELEAGKLEAHFAMFENHVQNNGASILQGNAESKLQGANLSRWVAGPFAMGDSITAFKQYAYLFKFPFEPRYVYRLSSQLTRMENTRLVYPGTKLNIKETNWRIGDTIPTPPTPVLLSKQSEQGYTHLPLTDWKNLRSKPARIRFQLPKDAAFVYIVLVPGTDTSGHYFIKHYNGNVVTAETGDYHIVLISKEGKALELPGIYRLVENGTNCITVYDGNYTISNKLTDSVVTMVATKTQLEYSTYANSTPILAAKPIAGGNSSIEGFITDQVSGDPIAGASIRLNNSAHSITNALGHYSINNIAAGNYKLEFRMVGYNLTVLTLVVLEGESKLQNVGMSVSEQHLDDVVVIGYGTTAKRSLTAAAISITNELSGRAAGLSVGASDHVRIRGVASIHNNNEPLYVVDGVIVSSLLEISSDAIASMEVLKDAAATAIYGARGANGVVIITTSGNLGPTLRTNFRDYAYWQPNIITDRNGKASIPIQYPDNITGWTNIIYAAGNRGRYGRSTTTTKTFKSLQGLLTVPLFVCATDSIELIGKALNYDTSTTSLTTLFKTKEQQLQSSVTVASNASSTTYLPVHVAATADSVIASFVIQDENDHSDGEEKKIPVAPVGSMETSGEFFALQTDSSFIIQPKIANSAVTIYAEAKLIDVLERELEELINYPQACMEQCANKLWGLTMMKQIKAAQQQSFNEEKKYASLLNRVLKNQNADGGWPWWPGGKSDLQITIKVLQALTQLDSSNTIHAAVRNANLYLQRIVKDLPVAQKLSALLATVETGHVFPYNMALDSILFKKLSIHQQWQMIRMMQLAGMDYNYYLKEAFTAKTESVTGAMYWGEPGWYWQNNRVATTILAYKVCSSDSIYRRYANNISQYFPEQRGNGCFSNTIEKAEIAALLLNDAILTGNHSVNTSLQINGSMVDQFPYSNKIPAGQPIQITKKGTGLLFLTSYQQWWNQQPNAVDSLFHIATSFKQEGKSISRNDLLQAGKTAVLEISINCKKSAEYVQLEIPVPAGCWYSSQNQNAGTHVEYLRDKVLVFFEKLPAGDFHYRIPLEVRFSGRFVINPAKVELMYYPVFFGRNEIKHVMVNR